MADQIIFTPERVGSLAAFAPGNGYKVRFYDTGTTTPKAVYTTSALSVQHPVPLVADSSGTFASVFTASGAVKAVITTADDAPFATVDPCFRTPVSASGADDVTFDATADITSTNVQDAIKEVNANIEEALLDAGLGVTESADVKANLDATTDPSGVTRFTADTTGTFPTGVSAADTGVVEEWRKTSTSGIQRLTSTAADRGFLRRMATSAWQTWREFVTVPQGPTEGDLIYRGSANFAALAKGTARQILAQNSGLTAPEWVSRQPTLASSTTSGTTVAFTGLAGWDEVLIEGIVTTDADIEVQVSADNGSTWRTTGYLSQVFTSAGGTAATDGVQITRAAGAATHHIRVSLTQLSTTAKTGIFGKCYGATRSQESSGYYDTTGEIHTAARIIGAGGTANMTAVNLKCYGVRA